MAYFDDCFDKLLGHEGGYVFNPADPGGETKWGISKRSYPNLDIKNLTVEDAKRIYWRDYWLRCGCEDLPRGLAFDVFDAAVNSGANQAARWLQTALGVRADGVIGPDTKAAAANGVPTGLDWYILGGFGGMSANSSGAGGGGGAALLVGGKAWNGGDCDATTTSAGGAGVGGSGSKNSSGNGGYAGGSGGSASGDAHGPSINGTDIYNNNLATAIQDIRHSIVLVPVTGAGGLGRQSPGGGGGGSSGITQGGGFGAGGGAISASGAYSGKGGTGGGGAGQNISYGYTSGAGGAGFVCIEFLETAL